MEDLTIAKNPAELRKFCIEQALKACPNPYPISNIIQDAERIFEFINSKKSE